MADRAALRPRQYALAYLAARTREEQKQAVEGCPKEWQDLVRSHVAAMRTKNAQGGKGR